MSEPVQTSLFNEPIVVHNRKRHQTVSELAQNPFLEFQTRFQLLVRKRPDLITNTLSNIFTMRLIGNKTHGDMAEIGIAEFINQFMYDYESQHVGKDLFRAKEHEEDIVVINNLTNKKIPISLKAYGDGPLQLSTNKDSEMFPFLRTKGTIIDSKKIIADVLSSESFQSLKFVNVMPLIYREDTKQCNIMIFDFEAMCENTSKILYVDANQKYDEETKKIINTTGRGRSHPIYMFLDNEGKYICEVRYGDKTANALQRGFWTNTKHAYGYFKSLTGWISYEHNLVLVKLFRLALNSSKVGHDAANTILQEDIHNLLLKQ